MGMEGRDDHDPLILEFPVREVPHEPTSRGRPQLKHQNPQSATSPNREAHCSIRNYTTNSRHLRRRSQLPQQPPENGEASLPNGVAQRHGILNTSQASINSYPKFVFTKKSGGAVDDGVCSICLSEYRESEMLRMLPDCRHCFHVMCVAETQRVVLRVPEFAAPDAAAGGGAAVALLRQAEAAVTRRRG
ncbi:hypothetical protein SASPL_130517 [Salvia splendens]|uniref:RING-type domain-containing protein n=1 Tax=Salvia splendens TaxID=180675 RepID=A0A8X8X8B4_SALSN|nr:hypothetical protein SASPL_130517 [Salvia splendens]